MRIRQFVLLAILLLLSLFFMQLGQTQHNAYLSWDMDLITTVDLFMLSEGSIPLHINHPGYGMYLLLLPFFKFGHFIQALSAGTFADFSQFMNPLIPITQTVDWIRALNVPAYLFMALCTFLGIWTLFRQSAKEWGSYFLGALAFLAVIFSPSFWDFHLQTNRTEFFSFLFLAGAFYFAVLFLKNSDRKSFWGTLLLLALAFVTKIQALFLMLFFMLVVEWKLRNSTFFLKRWEKILLYFGTVMFALLTLASMLVIIPSNYAAFANSYAPNVFFLLFFGFIVGYYFTRKMSPEVLNGMIRHPMVFLRAFKENPKLFIGGSESFSETPKNFFFVGISFVAMTMVALLGHLLLVDLGKSFEYLVYTFKILFLRISDYNTVSKTFMYYVENVVWNVNYHFFPIMMVVVLMIAILYETLKKRKEFSSKIPWHILIGTTGLLVLNLLIGNRRGPQDAMWNEFFFIWFVPLLSFMFLSSEKIKKSILWIFFSGLVAWKLTMLPAGTPFTLAHADHFYLDSMRYLRPVYYAPEDDQYLKNIFFTVGNGEGTYPATANRELIQRGLLLQASHHESILGLGHRVWVSPRFTMDRVGTLVNGSLITVNNKKDRWASVPDDLSGWDVVGGNVSSDFTFYFEDHRNYYVLVGGDGIPNDLGPCLTGDTQMFASENAAWTLLRVKKAFLGPCKLHLPEPRDVYIVTSDVVR